MILSSKLFRRIEWYFFNYEKLINLLMEYEEGIIGRAYRGIKNLQYAGRGVSAYRDPTALLGIQLAEGTRTINLYRDWVSVIEEIKSLYEKRNVFYPELIRLYYFENMTDWQVCNQLLIGRKTFRLMKNQIVFMTAQAAYQRRLLTTTDIREGTAWKTSAQG